MAWMPSGKGETRRSDGLDLCWVVDELRYTIPREVWMLRVEEACAGLTMFKLILYKTTGRP